MSIAITLAQTPATPRWLLTRYSSVTARRPSGGSSTDHDTRPRSSIGDSTSRADMREQVRRGRQRLSSHCPRRWGVYYFYRRFLGPSSREGTRMMLRKLSRGWLLGSLTVLAACGAARIVHQ